MIRRRTTAPSRRTGLRTIAIISSAVLGAVLVLGTASAVSALDLLKTIPHDGAQLDDLELTPDGTRIYGVGANNNLLIEVNVDPSSASYETQTATIALPGNSRGVAISPDGTRAYATIYLSSSTPGLVVVVDIVPSSATYRQILDTITVQVRPDGIAFSPDGLRAYVANTGLGVGSVIDTDPTSPTYNQVLATLNIFGEDLKEVVVPAPGDFAVFSGDLRVYYVDLRPSQPTFLQVIASPVHTWGSLGYSSVVGIAASNDGSRVYLSTYNAQALDVFDTAVGSPAFGTMLATDATGKFSGGLALSPDGTRLYRAATGGGGDVYSVDPSDPDYFTVVDTAGGPYGSYGVVYSADGTKDYVTGGGTGTSVIRVEGAGPVGVAPVITTTTIPGVTEGSPYSTTIAATGTPAPTFALQSGTFPAGVSLAPGTGVLSGTPTVSGDFTFTVRATNASGFDDQVLTLSVAPLPVAAPPVITTLTIPDGRAGAAYTTTVAATNGPSTFALTAGALPDGLGLASATGVISGTPTESGSFAFTVTATNAFGSDDQPFTLTVATAAVVPASLPLTGSDGDATIATVIVALGLIGAGSAMLLVARHRRTRAFD